MRALNFDGGRDHSPGDTKYMLYIPLGAEEELSVSCVRELIGEEVIGEGRRGCKAMGGSCESLRVKS